MSTDLSRLPLGQILHRSGLITEEQLNEALRIHDAEGNLLGQVLVRLGYISERDLGQALALQFGIPFELSPDEDFDPEVARQVDEALIERHGAIPLRMKDNTLIVGMVFPGNLTALDDIAALTGHRVRPTIITQHSLDRLLVTAFRLAEKEETSTDTQEPEVRLVQEHEVARIVQLVSDVMDQGLSMRASDVHIEPMLDCVRIRYRLDGVLTEGMRLPTSLGPGLVSRIKVLAGMDISERRLPQDGRFDLSFRGRQYDLRTAVVPTIHGEKVTIRVLDRSSEIRTTDNLGMPLEDQKTLLGMVHRTNGMVVVTGPTGSGKTTTLTALLAELNTPERHIVTIEDPVEYQVSGITQVQVNPKAGLTFASGLRSFLRHDPDVIMVGEIRDTETVELAIRSALTGHLVLTTMHTTSAASSVSRLFDMGVEPYLVAATLRGVVAQRLVRHLCPRCKKRVDMSTDIYTRFTSHLKDGEIYEPVGCNYCNGSGYRGRLPIYELLPISTEMAQIIASPGVTTSEIERQALAEGMTTMFQYGIDKVRTGKTSLAELLRILMPEE